MSSNVGGGSLNVCSVNETDIRSIVTQIDYFESIYSSAASCNITVADGSGFHQKANLKGGEDVQISFAGRSDSAIRMKFKVAKIGDRVRFKENMDGYLMVCVPQEMIDNNKKEIVKAYKGKKISELVKDWHEEYVKDSSTIKKELATNEQSEGTQEYYGTGRSPVTAIAWGAKEAKSAEAKASNYVYYQDRDGYHFRTIDKMLQGSEFATFVYNHQNIGAAGSTDPMKNIVSVDQAKDFDRNASSNNGAESDHWYYYDPVVGKVDAVDKKAKRDGQGDTTHTGKDPLVKDDPSARGKRYNMVVAPGMGAKDSKFVNARDKKLIENKRTLPEHGALSSTANLLDSLVMNIRVPGSTDLKPGIKIRINIPSNQEANQLDTRSGVYLVTSVRHVIHKDEQDTKYDCILECKSDSHSKPQNKVSGVA
jgi:hypothetical protein